MNNLRRKQIKRAEELLDMATELLNDVMENEDEAFYNLPDSLQESARGTQMEENVDILQDAIDQIEGVKDTLSNIE